MSIFLTLVYFLANFPKIFLSCGFELTHDCHSTSCPMSEGWFLLPQLCIDGWMTSVLFKLIHSIFKF